MGTLELELQGHEKYRYDTTRNSAHCGGYAPFTLGPRPLGRRVGDLVRPSGGFADASR